MAIYKNYTHSEGGIEQLEQQLLTANRKTLWVG